METLVTIIHVSAALFLILVVLVQGGNQGGMGAAFGGGNTQGVFGAAGATSFLGRLTYGAAAIFMVTSITLAVMQGGGGSIGLGKKIKEKAQQTQEQKVPETPKAPENQMPAEPTPKP